MHPRQLVAVRLFLLSCRASSSVGWRGIVVCGGLDKRPGGAYLTSMTATPTKTVIVTVRVPDDFRKRLKVAAAEADTSVQAVMLTALTNWLERRKKAAR